MGALFDLVRQSSVGFSPYLDHSVMHGARDTVIPDSLRSSDVCPGCSELPSKHGLDETDSGGHFLSLIARDIPSAITTLNCIRTSFAAF